MAHTKNTLLLCRNHRTHQQTTNETYLHQSNANANAAQNQRILLEQVQQLRHATLRVRMRHIAVGLSLGQLLAAGGRQRCIVEHLLPVRRSVRAAAVQFRLQQFPRHHVVLIVDHRAVESLGHQRL